MRLVFLGDGRWATGTLARLVEYGDEVVAVLLRRQQSDDSLADLASHFGIPTRSPEKINAPDCVRWVESLQPDLNVSVSYDQILGRSIIRSARLGTINAHAGKLPYYRGRSVVNWAIINGETEIGVTVHYMDEGVDTGDIILQPTIPVAWTDDYGDVLERLVVAIPQATAEAVRLVEGGQVTRRPQRRSEGTYFSRREEGDEWIDWSLPSERIYNLIRGVAPPGPGALTQIGDRLLRVHRATFDPTSPKFIGTPGQVIGVLLGEGVRVKTGSSSLVLNSVLIEPEERPRTPDIRIGTRLGLNLAAEVSRLRHEVHDLRRKLE